jgi:hypothetical protein
MNRFPLLNIAGASLLALSLAASAARADACAEPSSLSGSFAPKASPQGLFAKIVISASVSGSTIVAAQDTKKSWVNTNLVTLDGKRSASTKKVVKACQATFKKKGAAFHRWTPSQACPAAAANSSAKEAKSADECESVLGAGIDADSTTDAARLLKHERYHMRLACAIASEGNTKSGGAAAAKKLLPAVKKAIAKHEAQYDKDTNHGCKGDKQSEWEQKIDGSSAKWLP